MDLFRADRVLTGEVLETRVLGGNPEARAVDGVGGLGRPRALLFAATPEGADEGAAVPVLDVVLPLGRL